jgi:catechol 2,3-dioxygenase-like lactoylglutathione lyase family enzyme
MSGPFHIDPRIRALGKARIDVTRRAKSEAEWQAMWRPPRYPFPFIWERGWKQCIEYRVADFAAEVGFFIDVLGLPVEAFSPSYAMFTSPWQDFAFSVRQAEEGGPPTPPDTLSIQFQISDLEYTVEELQRRGVAFEQPPTLDEGLGPDLSKASFRTPNGVRVDLVGYKETGPSGALPPLPQPEQALPDKPADLEPAQAELFPAPAPAAEPQPEAVPDDEPVYTDLEDEPEPAEPDEPQADLLPTPTLAVDDQARRNMPGAADLHSFPLSRLGSSWRPAEKPRGNGSSTRFNPIRRENPSVHSIKRGQTPQDDPDETPEHE